MFSFPSSVAGLKGVGAKIVILEEASRLDEAMFQEVIIPLLGVKDTTLIGISTPLEAVRASNLQLFEFDYLSENVLRRTTFTGAQMKEALHAHKKGMRTDILPHAAKCFR